MKLLNTNQQHELEAHLVTLMFPGLSKNASKKLRRLAREKGVTYIDPALRKNLTRLICSIIRHDNTQYDQIVRMVGKERARFYVQGAITQQLEEITP